jgi:uncharacterized protein YbjT (DUF2867 family)
MRNKQILITGATGYIGGRIVPRLLDLDYQVRVLVRDPGRLQGRDWVEMVEVVQGDVLKPETLGSVMDGISAAYYMIHSMGGNGDFHERDLIAARNFGEAAKMAGVEQIVYLGGLGDPNADLSEHLASRQATGRALAEAGVPVTEFRAAIIVGSGSISFEMIRYLTERIPVMICPKWVFTRVQPIAIDDVLVYLIAALENTESRGKVIEIGGTDVFTYGDMMKGYAAVRNLKRALIPVPVLTPRLSSYWVHWITPVSASITRPLVEGLRNEVIVRDETARKIFPEIEPVDYKTAVEQALVSLETGEVETRWTDSLVSSLGNRSPVVLTTLEGIIIERRQIEIQASTDSVYGTFTRLGGEVGWLFFDWAWRIRGAIDRMLGGVGLRRGRRDPVDVREGDAIDFWRVETVNPGKLMRLRAEMKVPGRAWLQFEANPIENGQTQLIQTAYFAPKGLFGLLYWYALYPLHGLIFSGLIRGLKKLAESKSKKNLQNPKKLFYTC